jgi:hypothetical protein
MASGSPLHRAIAPCAGCRPRKQGHPQALHHRARRRGRIGNLVDKKVGQRQAASRYLKELAGTGMLKEMRAGKERLFIHPRLMQLLQQDSNEFARYD